MALTCCLLLDEASLVEYEYRRIVSAACSTAPSDNKREDRRTELPSQQELREAMAAAAQWAQEKRPTPVLRLCPDRSEHPLGLYQVHLGSRDMVDAIVQDVQGMARGSNQQLWLEEIHFCLERGIQWDNLQQEMLHAMIVARQVRGRLDALFRGQELRHRRILMPVQMKVILGTPRDPNVCQRLTEANDAIHPVFAPV